MISRISAQTRGQELNRSLFIAQRLRRFNAAAAGGEQILARGDQIPLNGELHQTGDVVDIELAHEAGAIGVDGLGAQFEPRGDFLGANAFDEQCEYLVFAGAESFDGIVRTGFSSGGEDLVQLELGRDVDASGQNLVEGLKQLIGGAGFEQERVDAATQRFDDGLAILTRG